MILEHALLPVRPGREVEFEQAFTGAKPIIAASPGFKNISLSRGLESPGTYLLLVEWESLEDHTHGFRGSEAYDRWKSLLHHFYDPFPTVEHFDPLSSMQRTGATVHLLCGLNGAGKTTLARELERSVPTVRFTLDAWMIRLFPDTGIDSPDYAPRAEACKQLIWDTAVKVLSAGTDVVLDWNQWSRARRTEWSSRARDEGFDVVLHHVSVPAETAIDRAERRAAGGIADAHVLTAGDIRHLAGIFEEPQADEGMRLVVHES